ncbi:hypothetical protein ACFWIA_26830 [Streptomyces sp. NPDC127068]|uniref:HAAS signaling domain-containing protein n=1 Tax=Streptomyces sp. NPDC127068 TaxID=3347127 RepID=UPI00364C4398
MNAVPTTLDHPLVRAYLDALDRECASLSAARRTELIADLSEHITVSVGHPATDAEVKQVLDALGDPRTVATAALAEEPAPATRPDGAAATASRTRTKRLLILLALTGVLTAGNLALGGVAVLVGLVLLWRAPEWQNSEKAIGTAAVLATPVILFGMAGLSAFGRLDVMTLMVTAAAALSVPTLGSLYLRQKARSAATA